MKKLLGKLVVLFAVFALTACGSSGTPSDGEDGKWDNNSLYLITDVGTIDDKSFNQGSFEGMEKFADEIGVKANYIKPADETEQAYLSAISDAVNAGAKVVVTPGYMFETAIYQAQELYPEVNFILVDGEPRSGDGEPASYKDNTVGILFAEEQSGFLAGYAAVKDGLTSLGFMGGYAVPAVVRFGYGYVAGADAAARELGIQITVRYTYLNSFGADPAHQTQAAAWYNDGVEVIFAAAGGAGNSVMAAAGSAGDGKWVIGVDVDQMSESTSVLTSAMKNLQLSVYTQVKSVYEDKFEGGKTHLLTIEEDMVQISDDFSRFTTFTEDDYKEIVEALKADKDGIRTSIPNTESADSADKLELTNTTVTVIE
ncbi:hypothetical protein AOC36_02685 [Erysipelothrix larvae]|uniref:ABC transporter substrate-binding protein PnrA-like domain-containing protein n=1 Tax=Erysipelothrix larvae TaxID=1514105 RepID=A0A0X8GYX6_9FIRM|nr:BMP family ABC transporter substrate-binding protein [Erysipelothrix larvae]AMC92929.1 hypothetical protein AOC36_02685 [Erysipelothrix larvae]